MLTTIRFQTSEPSGVLFTTTDDWGSDRLEIALSRGYYFYAHSSLFPFHPQASYFTLPAPSPPLCLIPSASSAPSLFPVVFYECYTVEKVKKLGSLKRVTVRIFKISK
jgi:hypothetical protein